MESPPRPPPSLPRSCATHVLCDPYLLGLMTSYQTGLPLALYEFWVQHDPTITETKTPYVVADHMDNLARLVATHGTDKTLDLLARVRYRTRGASRPQRPALWKVARLAIETNRLEMVQWTLDLPAITSHRDYRASIWWHDAIKSYRPGDLAVLELLTTHRQIDDQQFKHTFVNALGANAEYHLLKWVHEARPTVLASSARQLTYNAVRRGDFAAVRYVCDHISTDGVSLQTIELAYDNKRLDILQFLVAQRPNGLEGLTHSSFFQRKIAMDPDPDVRAFVETHARHFRRGLTCLVEQAVESNSIYELQEWHERGWLAEIAPVSIDRIVGYQGRKCLRFLLEHGFASATTEAMDNAARAKHWTIVDLLHEFRIGGCTVRAMEGAVLDGNLERIRFFQEQYHLVCPAPLTARAARDQSIETVRFLLEQAAAACSTDVMNEAAAHGRLHVVQYLHTHRSEGCTVDAIDNAATNGHYHVVTLLLQNRSEGFTRRAIVGALRNGHLAIVQLLYRHSPALFTSDLLHDLLLRGAFEIYMTLREANPADADEVLDRVMVLAGEEMELPTIRFILDVLGRRDLAHRAVDGAASCFDLKWLRALLAVTGPKSCRLSAVREVITKQARFDDTERWQYIAAVINACCDAGALETAVAVAKADVATELSRLRKLEKSFSTGARSLVPRTTPMHPLMLDTRTRAWAIQIIASDNYSTFDNDLQLRGPRNWATRAVYKRDMALLDALHELPPAAVQAYVRSGSKKATRSSGNVFGFHGARAAAIYCGHFEMLEWLCANLELPMEPTLLSEAVYYHQYAMAEWLVATHPVACTELDWSDKKQEPAYFGFRDGLLDWLDAHEAVRHALRLTGMMDYAVRRNDVAALARLYAWNPALFLTRETLVQLVNGAVSPAVVAFFLAIGCDVEDLRRTLAPKQRQLRKIQHYLAPVVTDADFETAALDRAIAKAASSSLTVLPSFALAGTAHPLLQDKRSRSWAIDVITSTDEDDDKNKERRDHSGQVTWAIRAVFKHDLAMLKVIHTLPAATVEAYLEAAGPMLRYPLLQSLSFHGARAAAIRVGDRLILEWLLTTVSLPIEPTLLDQAVYYHQYEIAEWLVAQYPAACTELDWTYKTVAPAAARQAVGLTHDLLEWLEAHEAVRNAVPMAGIIDVAARHNDVAALERLYGWRPEVFTPRPALVALADREECSDVINFLLEIGWDPEVFFQ